MDKIISDFKNVHMNYCVICGFNFNGYGNNPYPVVINGNCCDNCNNNVVIPARKAMKPKIYYLNKLDDINK